MSSYLVWKMNNWYSIRKNKLFWITSKFLISKPFCVSCSWKFYKKFFIYKYFRSIVCGNRRMGFWWSVSCNFFIGEIFYLNLRQSSGNHWSWELRWKTEIIKFSGYFHPLLRQVLIVFHPFFQHNSGKKWCIVAISGVDVCQR